MMTQQNSSNDLNNDLNNAKLEKLSPIYPSINIVNKLNTVTVPPTPFNTMVNMSTNKMQENNNSNQYTNTWENIFAYFNSLILGKNLDISGKSLDISIFDDLKNIDNNLQSDQQKITNLYHLAKNKRDALSPYQISYKNILNKLIKFIDHQKKQSNQAHLSYFFIKNNFSNIKKNYRNNFLESLNETFNSELSAPAKNSMVMAHLKNNKNFTEYKRFSMAIDSLFHKLHFIGNDTDQDPRVEQWKNIRAVIRLNMNSSSTDQTSIRDTLRRKMMKITLWGTSSKVKHYALRELIDLSIQEYKQYKRLTATLNTILNTIYAIEYNKTNQQHMIKIKM